MGVTLKRMRVSAAGRFRKDLKLLITVVYTVAEKQYKFYPRIFNK